MRRSSILRRTFVANAMLALLVALIGLALATAATRRLYLDSVTLHLRQTAQAFRQSLRSASAPADLDHWVKETFRDTGFRLTLIGRDGTVVADSLRDPARMEWHGDHPEVAAALNGREAADTRFSSTMGERRMYTALPVASSRRVAVLRIDMPLAAVSRQMAPTLRRLGWFFLSILGLALAIAWRSSRALTRPIIRLDRALARVGQGDLDTFVPPVGSDEIASLTTRFNGMVENQKALVAELRQRRQELEAIVASMSDGLLVLDGEGRILLLNRTLSRIVERQDWQGRPFWEVLRHDELSKLFRKSQQGETEVSGTVEWAGRAFLSSWTRLPDRPETVVTFADVSELKRLEQLKREFVAALSHELRTPLTAIKGYVETLLEEQGEAPHPYLGIIARHTERLILLARDLLTLSELEERPQEIARETVDLRRLLDDVLALFTRRIAEKGLTLARPAGSGTEKVLVTGDPARLDQLLINLIDNAVKYTDRGGITLALTAGATETCLEVIDSGIGIPEEALPRIFDRFFVVDRSRSRRSGGTGLGLSIVKHIVQQHGGRLEVESQPGRGSTFRVILPSAGSPA